MEAGNMYGIDTDNYWKKVKVMLNKLKELRYEYALLISGEDKSHCDYAYHLGFVSAYQTALKKFPLLLNQ